MHDRLETLLRERVVPSGDEGLASRIIAAAHPRTAKRPGFWQGFAELFVIPQPAYAFGVLLLLGVMAGFYLQPGEPADTPASMQAEITSFMAAEINFDGDFL